MSKIAIVVQQTIKPGQRAVYLEKMLAHARASRAEPGCLRFDVALPQTDENAVYLYELWADQAALDVHANTERIKAHRASTKEHVAESRITLCDLRDSGDA